MKNPPVILGTLTVVTTFSSILLSSAFVSAADSVIDEINITVPVSCTLSGTGMNTHVAEISNGLYRSDIGITSLKAFCNDNNGFAIYAAGYTGNKIGQTNSNKLVGTSASGNATIDTGLATSGNISNWAMKLTATSDSGDTTGTNALTIDSAPNLVNGVPTGNAAPFSSYHTVPSEYTKVAHKNSATSMNESTGGATLTSTYAAYISKTQPADTYSGQVIYTLIHPANADTPVHPDQVGVNFHGNGLTFSGGATKNKVVYSNVPMYEGTTPVISKTSNIDENGNSSGSYYNDNYLTTFDPIVIPGADRLKIIIRHNFDYGGLLFTPGYADSDDYSPWPSEWDNVWGEGEELYIYDGDTVTFNFRPYDEPSSEHNYGYYAQVYPLYTSEQENTIVSDITTFINYSGTYAETTTWNGEWYGELPSKEEYCDWDDELGEDVCTTYTETNTIFFTNEAEVITYLNQNNDLILGTSIDLYAYNPYKINYNGNNATAGTMTGFYTKLDTLSSTADLMAPNFKKTGYGFAGWSADQNATVNSNSKIYGPNEMITGNELTFDGNRETTLYAVWVSPTGIMQGWSGCSDLTNGRVIALTDSRDNNVYTIGKMQDGNCWMMENLRLDAANSSDSTKAQGFGGVFTGLANSEDVFGGTNSNSRYSTSNITGGNQAYRFPRYNNNNTNIGGTNSAGITLTATPGLWDGSHYDFEQENTGNNDHSQWYGYGNYYTWAAAMANTTSLDSASASEAANTSICPTGWFLPYGNNTGRGATSGGFSYLDIQMGGTGDAQKNSEPFGFDDSQDIDTTGTEASNRWRSYPNNFIYSGYLFGSRAVNRGNAGEYWSRTSYNSTSGEVYYLILSSSMLRPESYSSFVKGNAKSVRCLSQ